ncbi:MAG: hypothetical protein GY805_13715 [Chloroflexi bacterium]|nr:hypothetical protein [Chloroflexota bacterium]
MTIELTFRIQLKSDYHVSDGQRVGQTVDSALLRDHQQMPVLRGTALAGLIRDGFCDLRELVNQQKISRKHELDQKVEKRIFGAPSHAKQWVFSSTKPLGDGGKENGGRFGSTNAWRVRINPRTRRSDPQKLFIEEEGDGRIPFIFTVTCEQDSDQNRADGAVLVAAASMVKHLGSGRRRGRGHCQFQLIQASNFVTPGENESWHDAALDMFKQYWFDGKELEPLLKTAAEAEPAVEKDDGQLKRFRLIAQLQEPLLVAQKSQVANAFETLDNIPGVVLLGALASQAARKMNLADGSKELVQFTDMFLRGGVSVSGLLSADKQKSTLYPALAAPSSWVQCPLYPKIAKNSANIPHKLIDLLEKPNQKKCDECQPDKKDAPSKLEKVGGFISLSDFKHFELDKKSELHTTMERNGRVKEGDLYTYELIQGGQWFMGELSCKAGDWETLQTVTGLRKDTLYPIRLGKGIRRGYGLTYLLLESMDDDEPSPWTIKSLDARLHKDDDADTFEINMLLLTDAILLDRWGRFQHSFDQSLLAKLLKISTDKIASKVDQFVSSRIVDGFNTHRGVPRWRDEAIQAGSVVRFTLKAADTSEAAKILADIERNGIGLRRYEGFGRVAFNHPLFAKLKDAKHSLNGISLNNMDGLLDEMNESKLANMSSINQMTAERKTQSRMQEILNESQKDKEKGKQWKGLSDADIPLVRLLYLYRYQPLSELKAWLNEKDETKRLEHEQNLWGKRELTGRSRNSKLSDAALPLTNGLLEQMESNDVLPHVGLEMLAEQLSKQIEQNRAANKKKAAEVAAKKEELNHG